LLSLVCAAVVVVVIGVTSSGPAGSSVSATVKTFLLDWQEQNYSAAAAMTTGRPLVVTDAMQGVYRQLGAQDLSLDMRSIAVSGQVARAAFYASFDLGRGGLSWNYVGHFGLRRTAAGWRVIWSPSVIVPGLGRWDRLAVKTSLPSRGIVVDRQGRPLIPLSPAIEVGVIPDRVTDPLRTAGRLAGVAGLAQSDADEMASQIEAAPPRSFDELIQLTPSAYGRLRKKLNRIPALRHHQVTKRLFDSSVPVVTGTVATETAKTLVEDGDPYLPGTTIGLSGLEQAFQGTLAGKPTTSIVVQTTAGKVIKVLHQWPGVRASDLRTTISSRVQRAANAAIGAVGAVGLSAAIIAVDADNGQILAVSRHTEKGTPVVSPLDGRYQPGQAFTIASSIALLGATPLKADTRVSCPKSNPVGGQPFANVPAEPNLGAEPKFSDVFAHACSTAFAVLSYDLTSHELTGTAQELGIGGVPWKLPVPSFPGKMSSPGANQAQLAADTIGSGSVIVSPLAMALMAGAIDSGSWHAPKLVTIPTASTSSPKLSRRIVRQLQNLMWITVRSGAAKAAYQPGSPLYGQVGSAPLPGHHHLRAIWFVGYRGKVAFAVVVFARSAAFTPAVQIAGQFAAGLPQS
jgi:cell division protein FtsI/penicillin-binding protein 2